MKHSRLVAWVALAAVFAVAGAVLAQGQGGQGATPRMGCQQRFDAMDTNHDGKVTKDEFMAAPHHRENAEQMFKAMDVNGRGYITKDDSCSGRGTGMGMGKGMGKGQGAGTNQ